MTMKMMANGSLNVATISDCHLGHRLVGAAFMTSNLRAMFPACKETAELDIIFIAGDVFDSGLELCDPDVIIIQEWIYWMLVLCYTYDIKLRILEGTPSHDRHQSKQFLMVNAVLGQRKADVRYYCDLTIDYEDDGTSILYIPDEYNTENIDTYLEVVELMAKENITKVDFAIMHGMFSYQLPPGIPFNHHVEENYEKLVKYYIFIGHVHTTSTKGIILVQGSTDRICHGEEGDKGHMRAYVDLRTGAKRAVFFPNKKAKKFITLDVRKMAPDEVNVAISNLMDELPILSHIRIYIERDSLAMGIYNSYMNHFKNYHWSKKIEKLKVINADETIKMELKAEVINTRTITVLLTDIMTLKGETNKDMMDAFVLLGNLENDSD